MWRLYKRLYARWDNAFCCSLLKRLAESFRITWHLQLPYDAYQSRIWKLHAISQETHGFLGRLMQKCRLSLSAIHDDSLTVLHCKICTFVYSDDRSQAVALNEYVKNRMCD